MTTDPILSALGPPGPAAPAGRGREGAADAGAAFLAVLAGLLPAGPAARHGAPAPRSDIGATPGPAPVDRGPIGSGPEGTASDTPGRFGADLAGAADGVGLEGVALGPIAPRDGGRGGASSGRGQDTPTVPSVMPGSDAAGQAGGAPAPRDSAAPAGGGLPLPGAGHVNVPTPIEAGGTGQVAAPPALPPADAPAELRDAFALRLDRATSPEAGSTSRPSAAPPGAQIGVEITRAVANRIDHMVVRMDPPELGQVRIDLSFGNDGQLSARIAVERMETLEILQRDAHTLERSLHDAGLRADAGGLSFSLRREPGQGERDGAAPAQAPSEDPGGATAQSEADAGASLPRLRLLDIRA